MKFNEAEYAVSPELSQINERQIVLLDQETTDGDGWDYYCNGQIIRAVVFKNKISGTVREIVEEFHVEIKADEHEITSSCTCGSREAVCKHVVALLYSWVNDRDDFMNLGHLVRRLYDMEKIELIEVMERIFHDDPRKVRFLKKQDSHDDNPDIDDIID